MDELITWVRTYRQAKDADVRVECGEEIFRRVAPDLRYFIVNAASSHPAKDDLCQEILLAIATGLIRFEGDNDKAFWAWCYAIARNKLNSHFRQAATETKYLSPTPPEELWMLAEEAQDAALSPEDRAALKEAMALLLRAKPDCYEILWQHFILGLEYAEIAAERQLTYDGARMKVGRCLDTAQVLVS